MSLDTDVAAGRADLVRVVVCEEHALFRRGVIVGLERDASVEVVGEDSSAEDLLDVGLDDVPDAVFLDLTSSIGSIGEVVRGILERCPLAQVVVAVTDLDDPESYDALRSGAAGVLHKDIAVATAAEALRAVRSGNVLLTAYLATRILAEYGEFAQRARAGEVLPTLSDDERRVLTLIADGSPATAVAVAARLPTATARNLVRNAVRKLQAQVAKEAVATAA